MDVTFANLKDRLLTSYWFVPTLMAAAAFALAILSLEIDRRVQAELIRRIGFFWNGGADGARELLSTVAGSTITVAGVVFSMTLVVLSLASSQFGPRILRHFMADRVTQVVLGTFLANFVFALLALRNVRSLEEMRFVPSVSVTIALALTLASLGVLIYFIHHVARSIHAPQLVARVGEDLLRAINALFPEQLGHPPPDEAPRDPAALLPADFDAQSRPIRARHSGYLQSVDADDLMERATGEDLVARILVRPGRFVIEGQPLAQVWPAAQIDDGVTDALGDAFVVDRERTPTQDVEMLVEQLVQVAVRALSPGINDPFTAMTCIDWLGAALARAARRSFPETARYDAHGRLRVLVDDPLTFTGLLALGLDPIRRYGRDSVEVLARLLEMLGQVLAQTDAPDRRREIARHAKLIHRMAEQSAAEVADRDELRERYLRIARAMSRQL